MPPPLPSAPSTRKTRGAYFTPEALVDLVVDGVVGPIVSRWPGETITVLDPACGDGRFLQAAAERLIAAGRSVAVHGVDLDAATAAAARQALESLAARHPGRVAVRVDVGDALAVDWSADGFHLVVGNPPFLSQLSALTSRGGASRRGGGPYADVAAEFLHLAADVARPDGGRVGLILPQSILASRDAAPIRRSVDDVCDRVWSWWSPRRHFDADVVVCALGFERCSERRAGVGRPRASVWTDVVLDAVGVPKLPKLRQVGTVGDRATCSVGFRSEYYGLVGAVDDAPEGTGPRLVTSGLIDPLRCHWGERSVTFAGTEMTAPRVDRSRLDHRTAAWVAANLRPKVVVANQTRALECVVDHDGTMVPGVPVLAVAPLAGTDVWELAAVLTSPVATLWAWHQAAGTGLSGRTVRLSPAVLATMPWPAGPLGDAVAAARAGDVERCGTLANRAFGLSSRSDAALSAWWTAQLHKQRFG